MRQTQAKTFKPSCRSLRAAYVSMSLPLVSWTGKVCSNAAFECCGKWFSLRVQSLLSLCSSANRIGASAEPVSPAFRKLGCPCSPLLHLAFEGCSFSGSPATWQLDRLNDSGRKHSNKQGSYIDQLVLPPLVSTTRLGLLFSFAKLKPGTLTDPDSISLGVVACGSAFVRPTPPKTGWFRLVSPQNHPQTGVPTQGKGTDPQRKRE